MSDLNLAVIEAVVGLFKVAISALLLIAVFRSVRDADYAVASVAGLVFLALAMDAGADKIRNAIKEKR